MGLPPSPNRSARDGEVPEGRSVPPSRDSPLPVLLLAALALLLIPPVVFGVVALAEGMGVAGTLSAISSQYAVRRLNLLTVALLSFLPLLVLALLVWIVARFTPVRASRRSMALGGALGILAIMLWVNFEFWGVYLPERVPPGFPHGLEFVIGPLYFAPVAMLVGLGAAALLHRSSR